MKDCSLGLVALSLFVATLPVACGDGGGGNGTGTLTLSITDAPVDGATRVVVEFTGVELKPANGDRVLFTFDTPRQIDLLGLQGNASTPLLDGVEVPAGDYNWLRLAVNAERGVLDSFIELEGGAQESLFVPSGAQSGLKLHSGFVVAQGGVADFTIDFNLRKSVHDPQGHPDFYLRPSLRLVNNLEVGSLSGTVAGDIVTDSSCTNGPDHDIGNAVYVYTGSAAVVDDVGSANEPLTTALVEWDGDSGEFRYQVGFLAEGTYSVAFTCQGADDVPSTDDAIVFVGAADVVITANTESVHDF